MNSKDGSVRLSPAQIGHHLPTAVRPLPPVSIARCSSPPAPSLRSTASRVQLCSVPALSIDGADGRDGDSFGDDEDHNNNDRVLVASSAVSEIVSFWDASIKDNGGQMGENVLRLEDVILLLYASFSCIYYMVPVSNLS